MSLVILLAFAGVFIYLLWITYSKYRESIGTRWERIKSAFKYSATVAWARINALSVLAIGLIEKLGDVLGIPGLKDAVAPFLAPEYLLAYTAVVLIGAEIARRRTL